MGNCFKTSSHDDISLLRDSDVSDNGESNVHNVPPPPPYQVSINGSVIVLDRCRQAGRMSLCCYEHATGV